MHLQGLDHVNVRCDAAQLPAMVAFWSDVLGLRNGARPAFDFPGAWLYLGEQPVVHLSGRNPVAKGAGERASPVDHVAFNARDIVATRDRLRRANVAWQEQTVPGGQRAQIFLTDPAGTRVELLFDLACEAQSSS